MDKIFDVEIDGQVTLPDGSTLGPLEETTVNVVQPSEGISDPIIENAKETGGFGWTEQSEQTVITWDGNTEGRDVLTIIDSEHPDDVIRMYKVAEYSSKQFTENCEFFVAGSQLRDVTLYTYDHAEMYGVVYPLAIRTDGTDFDIQHVGTVHAESSGVYFIDLDGAYVESLTYGTPDTVHKIDEKYISGGGGAMVVTFNVTISEDGNTVEATMTPQEVRAKVVDGVIVGGVVKAQIPDVGEMVIPVGCATFNNGDIAFGLMAVNENSLVYYIEQNEAEWDFNSL